MQKKSHSLKNVFIHHHSKIPTYLVCLHFNIGNLYEGIKCIEKCESFYTWLWERIAYFTALETRWVPGQKYSNPLRRVTGWDNLGSPGPELHQTCTVLMWRHLVATLTYCTSDHPWRRFPDGRDYTVMRVHNQAAQRRFSYLFRNMLNPRPADYSYLPAWRQIFLNVNVFKLGYFVCHGKMQLVRER